MTASPFIPRPGRDIAPTELRQAITRKVMQSVGAGQHRPADEAPIQALTEREREVLTEIGRGLSKQEISQSRSSARPQPGHTSAGCWRS